MKMMAGPSGLYNAPIVKVLLFGSVGSSLFVHALKHLTMPSSISLTSQMVRLVTHNLFFTGVGDAVTSVILLYSFRIFERQMGSAKFAVFTLTTWMTYALLFLIWLVLQPQRSAPISGPYGLIFALLVQYYFEIPASHHFRVLGIRTSDKLLIYILSIQLLLSNLPTSLVAGVAGIGAGLVYRSDILPFKKLTLPSFIVRPFSQWILPLLQSPQTYRPTRPLPRPAGAPPRTTPHPPASEVTIGMLMDMGFSREGVQAALIQANHDPELAAAILLDSN